MLIFIIEKTYMYLLPTAFVSCYVMLLAWSALASIPTECKKHFIYTELALTKIYE